MPKILQKMPEPEDRKDKSGLRVHQIRVLRALRESKGPLSRSKIAEKAGITLTVVARALGYENKEKREHFEKHGKEGGFLSLLTLGLVREMPLDIDGKIEVCHQLTKEGLAAVEEVQGVSIGPPVSSY